MADRVKYFVLGILFLVVAGVIAYDKWNSVPAQPSTSEAGADDDLFSFEVGTDRNRSAAERREGRADLSIPPGPAPRPVPAPEPRPEPKPPAPRPQPPAPKPQPAPLVERVHVVAAGESLEAIAVRYYGTRKGVAWIAKANGLKDVNLIRKGQKLVIPARKELKARPVGTPGKAAPVRPADAKVPEHYRVREGDGDLYAICRRFYGSKGLAARVARIMELNSMWSAEVATGTVLVLESR